MTEKKNGEIFMRITNKEIYGDIKILNSKIDEFISSQKVINQGTKDILEVHDKGIEKNSKAVGKMMYLVLTGFITIVGWLMLIMFNIL